jgi:hypothetical protein
MRPTSKNMDVRARRPYVAARRGREGALSHREVSIGLEFLLILSALLSAATGVLTGARAPEARLHHAAAAIEAADAVAPRPADEAQAVKAFAPALDFASLAAPVASAALDLAASTPLETIRLLE